jgi:hypothetical protein
MPFENLLDQGIKSLQDLAMTDPVTYAELKHKLANDPQLAHQASELFQPHRVPSTGAMQAPESQESFNLQFLMLQQTMQKEALMYQVISNIMKTKHDTVKNSISNIR